MALPFAWDARKAAANVREHGVSFPEAASAFADPTSSTDQRAAREPSGTDCI